MKRFLIAAGVVLVIAAIVLGSVAGRRREPGVEVELEAVARRDISRIVKASGVIDPRVKVNISAHVIGRIEHLYVEEGQEVEAGQPFLQLEREAFQAAVDDWTARLSQARTQVRRAEIDLADAELREKRFVRLADEGIVSPEQREQAVLGRAGAALALEQAKDAVQQAQANLTKARDDLGKTTINAPLSGRIINLSAEEGEVVVSGTMNNPASVIGTIADLSEILAEVDVDETEIVYVAVGQEVKLVVDAIPDRPYRGRVVEVGSSGFEKRTQQDVTFFKVKALLEDADGGLRPGMSVRAEIVTATHEDTLVVPIQAVVQRPVTAKEGAAKDDEERPVVFVEEAGKAHQRPVSTGISDATHVEVEGGLEGVGRIVVGPYRVLRDLKDGDVIRPEKDEDGRETRKVNADRRAGPDGEAGGS